MVSSPVFLAMKSHLLLPQCSQNVSYCATLELSYLGNLVKRLDGRKVFAGIFVGVLLVWYETKLIEEIPILVQLLIADFAFVSKDLYKKLKVEFLLDPEDAVEHYEKTGRKKAEEANLMAEENCEKQLGSLSHVGQIEFIRGMYDSVIPKCILLGLIYKVMSLCDCHRIQ